MNILMLGFGAKKRKTNKTYSPKGDLPTIYPTMNKIESS